MKNTHQWQWAVTLCSTVVLCGTLAAQTPSPSEPAPERTADVEPAERAADLLEP
jgi:hypothetical protein